MMKYFIYAIAVIHLGCSTSLGEETGFDRQLPAPDSIHIIALSIVAAFRSGIFVLAISST